MKPYYEHNGITIYHGDCREVLPTLTEAVDVVITDPPYGLDFPYPEYVDTRENLIALIGGFLPVTRAMASRVVVLCGPTQIALYPPSDWVGVVTWNTTGSFGMYGYNQWTPVLCYGSDVEGFGSVNGVLKSDTIHISGGAGVGFMRGKDESLHTCPKPITMMNRVVARYSNSDNVVLDPFMGSGTTLVAAKHLGRRAIGIEQDERYCEIAAQRLSQEVMALDGVG